MRKHPSIKLYMILFLSVFCVGCTRGDVRQEPQQVSLQSSTPGEKVEEIQSMDVTPGWKLHAEEPVTLDWYINFSWYTTPWGGNLVSDKITQETGVDINFITPAGNETEKLNSLIASNTLPDVITLAWSDTQVGEMIENDMVYALDELADTYDPYWYQVADPVIVDWFTQKDGHIYAYPNCAYSPEDMEAHDNIASNQTFLVRKDIYEAIGSPDMTTPEGFKAAIAKAVELYPTVNEEPLIPFGLTEFTAVGNTALDEYLPNLLAIPYEKDGKYYDRAVDQELVRWLKTFRELGEEGYLPEDIFIDKRAQMEEKIAEGRYFCMLFQRTDLATQEKLLYTKDPEKIYIAVDGPKNSKGDDYRLPGSGINGWTVTLISKNCKNPDRALELCSYMMSRHGQNLIWLGVEGETWDYVDGVETLHPDIQELLTNDRVKFDALYGADAAYWMLIDNVMALDWYTGLPEPLGQMERWTYPYVINASEYEISLPAGSDAAEIKAKIDAEWGRLLPQLLLTETEQEFDDLWNTYCQDRIRWGVRSVLEQKTQLMNEAKEKLGVE